MTSDEELKRVRDQLVADVQDLAEVIEEKGDYYTDEYAERIIRSQLNQLADDIESMSEMVGDGDMIEVANTPETEK